MGDRFFPVLTEPIIDSTSWDFLSEGNINSSRYRRALADALGLTNARRLSYNPSAPPRRIPRPVDYPNSPHHFVYKGTLEAEGILNDPHLTLLDWGHDDAIAVALPHALFVIRNSCVSSQLFQVPSNKAPITCVSWAPHSSRIAVALSDSEVQLWDAQAGRLLRTVDGGVHTDYVSSMSWRDLHCLTTGGADGLIDANDMRVPVSQQYRFSGHEATVCGLSFAGDGIQLASGDEEGVVSTWDVRHNQHCHLLEGHRGVVKALTWCPFDRYGLVTGGGDGDKRIKFWDARTGDLNYTINTGSDVWGLGWNMEDKALLSAHGEPRSMLVSWRYSTKFRLERIPFRDESGRCSPVTCMTSSPDGRNLAVVMAREEDIDLWNLVGTNQPPTTPESKTKAKLASREGNSSFFTRFDHIR